MSLARNVSLPNASQDSQHRANLKRFTSVDKRFDDQDKLLTRMERQIQLLVTAVIGQEEIGSTGLVKRMHDVEGKVAKHEKQRTFFAGICAAVSAICSGVAAIIFGHK